MNPTKIPLPLLLLIVLLLAGCLAIPENAVQTNMMAPSRSGPSEARPEVTPANPYIEVPVGSSTGKLAHSPAGSQSPTLQSTTSQPTESLLPVWTPLPYEELAATPDPSRYTFDRFTNQSPDGEWALTITNAVPVLDKDGVPTGDQAYDQVKLARVDGSVEWTLLDEWSNYGLGSGRYGPLFWSPSGDTLYLTYQPIPDGCPSFVNGSNLLKVDLNSREMTELLPYAGLWLALSPDEKTVAYIGFGERGLVLRDLTTGTEREVDINPGRAYSAGHIIWSTDGKELVMTLALDFCSPEPKSAILRVDTGTLETDVLVEGDDRPFFTAGWPEAGKVILKDRDGLVWWLDLDSGEISP